MKIYIKPEIVIIRAVATQLMGISQNGLNSADNTLHHSDSQTDTKGPGTGGDDYGNGDDDLEAAKRLFSGGDPLWHGYSPWE